MSNTTQTIILSGNDSINFANSIFRPIVRLQLPGKELVCLMNLLN